jgi:Domain of unknown function (DUF4157)
MRVRCVVSGGECSEYVEKHERGAAELQRDRPGPAHPELEHGSAVPGIVRDVIGSAGRRLPGVCNDFRKRFGADLGKVRVHAGRQADRWAQAVSATAYTVAKRGAPAGAPPGMRNPALARPHLASAGLQRDYAVGKSQRSARCRRGDL